MAICDYVKDDNLQNPLYKFHYIMYEKDKDISKEQFFKNLIDNQITDDSIETEWLIKNIQAHFYKLVNTILNLLEFQNVKENNKNIELNIDMEMTIVNLLEYFYIKKSTIIDLLDIFYINFFKIDKTNKKKLNELIKKEMNEFLTSREKEYSELRDLYKDEIIEVRNRIIHDKGYSIKSYIKNNKFIFQVYNMHLDEQIYPNPIYSYYSQNELPNRPPLIKVNDYLVFNLCALYNYMDVYLDFLLAKKGFDINSIDGIYKTIINSSKYIMYTKSNLSLLQKKFKELEDKIEMIRQDI